MSSTVTTSHLTVPEVAGELEMSSDGVYKLIRRGKLKAVRVSERKTYISRLALDAYRRRLNGEAPDTQRPRSTASVDELRLEFERETGYSPEDWIAEWKRERIEDSAKNAQTLVRAVGLRAEPRSRRQTTSRGGTARVAGNRAKQRRADERKGAARPPSKRKKQAV